MTAPTVLSDSVPPPPRRDFIRRTGAVAGAALVLAAGLAGCGLFDRGPPKPCPRVSILRDAGSLTQFKPGPGRDLIDVRFEATFGEMSLSCTYDDNVITMIVGLQLFAARGPAADAPATELRYFVAVIDRAQRILVKERFVSNVEFPRNRNRAGVAEEIAPRIPLRRDESAADYEILVGFQLSPAELEYNRLKAVR